MLNFDAFFVLGIGLGVIIAIILVVMRIKNGAKSIPLEDGLAALTYTYGAVAAVKICTVVTFDSELPIDVLTRLYIFIGGFVTFWVASSGLISQLRKKPEETKRSKAK